MKSLSLVTLATLALSSAFADEKADAMKLGASKYVLCGACHGMDGKGQPAPGMNFAPNFADSKIASDASAEAMALSVLKGIKKEDAKYLQMMLPLETSLNDDELAAVLTYVRNKFAGKDDLVTADQAKAWRAKYEGTTGQVTRADLLKLVTPDEGEEKESGEGEEEEEKAAE